ncbi:MAG: Dna2/Cas4 domain-containing protein [Deltaproteobacteria bacterium]|nr:Dna2/Cas4 domain-containing protein [Deltaproteobacteria bacterium]
MDSAYVKALVLEAFKRSYAEGEEGTPIDDGIIFVTEAVGCLRKSYFIRRSPLPLPDRLYVIFEIGKGVHYIIQRFLPVEAQFEVPCEVDLGPCVLRGRADVVLNESILELKTIAKIREEYLPYQHHVKQLQAYLWMLDKPRGYIVYIEKGGGRIHVVEVHRDAGVWAEVCNRARLLHEHLVKGEPPPPEPSPLCRICDYAKLCGGGGGGT